MSDQYSNSSSFGADPANMPKESEQSRALAPIAPSAGVPVAYSGDPSPRQDVIRGGIDPVSLYHSFRRRWLLATCMGAFVGAIAAVALYIALPESSSASQLFQISSKTQAVLDGGLDQETGFDTFRQTQAVLMQSQSVLNRALGEDGVTQSEFFEDVPEEGRWQYLRDNLKITFPKDSEVMVVTLSGSIPTDQLRKIVEAVGYAYEEEVLVSARIERLRPSQILEDSLAQINKKIIRKSRDLEDLLKEKGEGFGSLGGEVDPETRLLTSEAMSLQSKVADLKEQQITMSAEFARNKRYIQDRQLLEQRIEEAVAGMDETKQLEAEVLYIKTQLRDLSQNAGPRSQGAIRPVQERYQFLLNTLAQHKESTKKRMLEEHRRKPNAEIRLLTQDFQQQAALMRQQQAQAEERIEEVTETLRERGATSTDLIMRRNEIDGLQGVAATIASRISQWEVEAEAEDRIKNLGIETAPGINTHTRYAIAGIGGLACFGLVCFGIAYMEFHNRRLNGPEQVDEGLGIRVIGTLPSLSGRKALDPHHPVVAQLTESIDSVRTALMHESTRDKRQIVMVTSAAAMEGRTTVASQLAASLARANRRTLLIDGDLRRPALHNLFDVPLEDGLCEVLRAETDVADVIRPTHAEGLWLITAGYCDADAVHSLATDQVQPIFEKLRADYDFIIIDGAPILGLSDSLLFGQQCDGAILSVLRDHTAVPKIHKSAQLMESVGIRLIGSVVNGVVTKADRRVTHLQAVAPKSEQKQLEQVDA